jgi:hypothetical protein
MRLLRNIAGVAGAELVVLLAVAAAIYVFTDGGAALNAALFATEKF